MTKKQTEDLENAVEETETVDATPENETGAEQIEEMDDKDLASGVKDSWSRTNALSVAMTKLGSMEKNAMVDFFNKSMAQIGHEADKVGDVAGRNKASVAMKPSAASAANLKKAIKEDLEVIFGGNETLTEDFRDKVNTLFESAVNARIVLLEAELQDAYETCLEEEITEVTEALIDKVDDYLGYVCQEWIEENEVAIQSALRSEITEEFVEDLRGLFLEHNIEVPESKIDVLDMLADKVDNLEESLNTVMVENKTLHEAVSEYERYRVIESKSIGLTPLQAEKFEKLAEGVEYDGEVENFEKSLDIIKEAHFSNKGKSAKSGLVTEEISHDPNAPEMTDERPIDPRMAPYVTALKKTIRA